MFKFRNKYVTRTAAAPRGPRGSGCGCNRPRGSGVYTGGAGAAELQQVDRALQQQEALRFPLTNATPELLAGRQAVNQPISGGTPPFELPMIPQQEPGPSYTGPLRMTATANAAGGVQLTGAVPEPPPAPRAPVEDAPKLTFYSKWARPPYPPGWGKAEYLAYARKQAADAKVYIGEANAALQHVQGHPIQAFPGYLDGALQAYDEGMVTLLEAVYAGATRDEVKPVLKALSPVLQALPSLVAKGMTRAAELGFQLGFDEGWYQGWQAGYEARAEDEESMWDWIKKAVGAGLGIAVALVGAVLAVALANMGKR